jgi:hypothetical protein
VADSGALAAQNVVAEYEIIATLADAVVLSMSLLGLMVYGTAIVTSCIPGGQAAGLELMNAGTKIFQARDSCAEQAIKGLNQLQRALPFLCAVNSARVISSNRISSEGNERYIGLAIPLPLTGTGVDFPDDDAAQSSEQELSKGNEETARHTQEAEEAFNKMQEAKEEGYKADCGQHPSYCLYERAAQLGGLAGAQNPYFSSVDSWLFDYAFARAKPYYEARLAHEQAASDALDEQVRSFARSRLYNFAVAEMAQGYARTAPDGTLEAYFPLLPKNNDELRNTSLYTEQVYPVSANNVMHGVATCPACSAANLAGYASVAQLESGAYTSCEICNFSVNTIGSVASASSNTTVGFEYHYRKVAEAAAHYQQAAEEYSKATEKAKESASKNFDVFKEALEALKAPRINPCPPGKNGCIAIVIDPCARSIPSIFAPSLVPGKAELAPRIAISAAAMAAEPASADNTIIASFFERVKNNAPRSSGAGIALGIFDGVFDMWSYALLAYTEGSKALTKGLGDFLRGIPLIGSTPLAAWAESALQESLEAVGLQGVDLRVPKPVIVNSLHVARASNSPMGNALIEAKEYYASGAAAGDESLPEAFSSTFLDALEQQGNEVLNAECTLFTISFGDFPGSPKIPLTISIPPALAQGGKSLMADARSALDDALRGG